MGSITLLDERLRDFDFEDVTLLDSYELNGFSLEMKYLLSLDEERLLRGFCDIAGIKSSATLYGGWESSNIQGHTMGHYLTALSQGFAYSKNEELKRKIHRIVAVLSECQNKESGYLAAIPEEHYKKTETGNANGIWVPWYTMHKVLSGLISAYELAEEKLALEAASRLGDWVYSLTSKWDDETQCKVLSIEYGGMNDCLYRLYSHTKSEKHLSAAHAFDELPLFEALKDKKDILDGKHANTTIPKFIGALRRYTVLGEGEEFYLEAAAAFWEIVTSDHTYITGGNSEWEHFGKSRILDAERTECNCETCNTYNMLKLTRELFKLTGEKKYADYYEKAFINAILSSQNPETGMTTYFQPMATGFFKVYSSAEENFWCCTGSGMESFSKLGDSIYFRSSNGIYINRYTSSKVTFREKELTVTQKSTLPEVKFTINGNGKCDFFFRIPHWCNKKPEVKINGRNASYKEERGYIVLSEEWQDNDEINLLLPMEITVHSLPDNENSVSFCYGPYLLSADLGESNMLTGLTGVNVTVPLADEGINDIIRPDYDKKEWLRDINENLVRQGDALAFELTKADRSLIFSPHYRQHKKRYGIYFILK